MRPRPPPFTKKSSQGDDETDLLKAEVESLKSQLRSALDRSRTDSVVGEGSEATTATGKPLLFALSKQSELAVARDEISRLASSLGDMASGKAEVVEALEEVGRELDAARAKCER